MSTSFLNVVTRTQLPVASPTAWTTVALDTYVSVPAGATYVLLEVDNQTSTSYTYGFQASDDSTNYVFAAASRFTRCDWVPINVAKSLSLYTGSTANLKFYVRAYSNHIKPISSVDLSGFVTGTSATVINVSSNLPAPAINGAAVVMINNTNQLTLGPVGSTTTLPVNYYLPKQIDIIPLTSSMQFEVKTGLTNGLTAGSLTLIGFIPAGRIVGNFGTSTETLSTVSTWQDLSVVDTTGALDIWRYRGTSSANLYGKGSGGTTSGITSYNPAHNPHYIAPAVTGDSHNGKTAWWANDVTSAKVYYVGKLLPTYTDPTVNGGNSFTRGSSLNILSVPTTYTSLTSVTIGSLTMDTIQASYAGSFTFTAPRFINGQTYPAYGTYTLTATDGTNTFTDATVQLVPQSTEATVTITDVSNSGLGYLQSHTSLSVGDVVTYKTAASLGVASNGIGADGRIFTDYVGVQTLWIRNASTGVMTRVSITSDTLNNTPDVFTFVPATNVPQSSTITSNSITVAGLSSAASISITGGTYSKNGAAYTASAGSVGNGDVITVQVVSSANLLWSTSATLTIGNLSDTFTVQTTSVIPDSVPDAFTFTAQTAVNPSTAITSNTITVAGTTVGTPVPWSVTNGTASVNGGSFASSGTAYLGDTIAVKLTSSSGYSTLVSAVLTLGGVTGQFDVTTRAVDTTPNAFSLTSVTNAELNTVTTSVSVTVSGVDAGQNVPISITGGTYSVNGGAYTASAGNVLLGDVITVRATSSGSYATLVTSTLNIGGVTSSFNVTTRAADLVPDAFTFTAATGAEASTATTSNSITVTGVDAGQNVAISITGGTYSVNGGAYTASAGNVQLNDTVTVKVTSSASYSTLASATLTIGGVTGTFNVTTRAVDLVPDAFTFTTTSGASVSTPTTSNSITVTGVDAGQNVPISITGGTYSINGGAYTASAGNVQLNDTVTVKVTSSASNNTTVSTTLTIGGVSSTFSVITGTPDITPDAFTFTAATNVSLSTVTTSNSITIAGVTNGVDIPVSITGGTYSINGGAYTSSSGNVRLGDTVTVKVTSSASYNTLASATLTVGGVPGTFNVTTRVADTTPDAFTFTAATGAEVSTATTSNSITVLGVDTGVAVAISIAGGTYSVNGGAYTASAGNVQLNDTVTVKVTSSASYSTLASATLTIGGVAATYNVTTRAADVTPNAFTFNTVSNIDISTISTSNSITVLGVDAGQNVPISITGGTYAINGGTYTSTSGTVQLNDTVTIQLTSSGSYATLASATLTIGGVSATYNVTTKAAITVISPTIAAGSTNNTLTVVGISAANSLTINGVAMQLSGSGTSYSFDVPAESNGASYPKFGTVAVVITDGTNSATTNVTFTPTASQSYVTLTSVGTLVGYIGYYTSCNIGDQVVFPSASSLGVAANGVDVDGRIFTDYSGTQTMWLRSFTTGLLTQMTVITPAVVSVPNAFTLTAATGVNPSTDTISNSITVLGTTANLNIPISITGGLYSVNGGTYTSVTGTVKLNDTVRVKVTSSASYSTLTPAVLNIGGTTATYNVTTRAAITAPTAFSFTPVIGSALATPITSNSITVLGVDAGQSIPITITGSGTYSINGGTYTSLAGTVQLNDTVTVRITSSASYSTTVSTTLNIGGVTASFGDTTRAAITTPTAFTFAPVTNSALSTPIASSSMTVLGVDSGVNIPVSITGGTYSVNGGAYTAVSGNVLLNDIITVKVTSSASYNTSVSATLTVGGVSATFTDTTRVADTTPDAFTFTTVTNASVSTATTSNSITVTGVDAGQNVPISITGGTYSVNGGAYTASAGNVQLNDTVTVKVTSSSSTNTTTSTTLTIGGVNGTFSVSTGSTVTVPDAFNFTAATGVNPLTSTTSNTISVTGVTGGIDIPISITGGYYSIDNGGGGGFGAFTNVSGNVRLGYLVKVQTTSSASYSSTTSTTLTIGGVPGTFNVTTRAVDVTPDAFSFAAVTNAALSSVITSSPITVTGVDSGQNVPITITGGAYSINGGAYTASAGNVHLNDTVTIQVNSSALNSTGVTATVTIGGIVGTFTATTLAIIPDTTPDAFTFTSATGVLRGTTVESGTITVSGINTSTTISIVGGVYSINGGAYTASPGTVTAGNTVKVRVTSSASYSTPTVATLTIGGVVGTFTATTVPDLTLPIILSVNGGNPLVNGATINIAMQNIHAADVLQVVFTQGVNTFIVYPTTVSTYVISVVVPNLVSGVPTDITVNEFASARSLRNDISAILARLDVLELG